MKRTHTFIPEQMLARLKAIADRTGVSVSEVIRAAITNFLSKEKK